MDEVRLNCLFSSFVDDDLLLLLFDRPIKLKKPWLSNFLVEFDDDEDVEGCVIVFNDDVFTNKLLDGIEFSIEDECLSVARRA